jgi:hypothetical protein
MRIVSPAPPETPRAFSPLNELVRSLARLAGPHTYSMTARLVGERDATRIELTATRSSHREFQEYAYQVSMNTLEHDGPSLVAQQFARNARRALANAPVAFRKLSSGRRFHR